MFSRKEYVLAEIYQKSSVIVTFLEGDVTDLPLDLVFAPVRPTSYELGLILTKIMNITNNDSFTLKLWLLSF